MVLRPLVVLLAALTAAPVAAQNMDAVVIDRVEWKVLGWNDACGVAYSVLSYPRLGDAMAGEPISTRVGTIDIKVGTEESTRRWTLEADGAMSWSSRAYDKAARDLRRGGYDRRGYPETVRDGAIGDQPGLAQTILSTGTLSPRLTEGWPDEGWRWAGADYNRLTTCALLVYEDRAHPHRYRFLLARVYNPRARIDRAYAHASNGRLLFDGGDLQAGAAEAEIAAKLAPELPIARYEHAAMLALTGRQNESMRELAEAVKLDPKLADRARSDLDFQDLSRRDDFKDIVK